MARLARNAGVIGRQAKIAESKKRERDRQDSGSGINKARRTSPSTIIIRTSKQNMCLITEGSLSWTYPYFHVFSLRLLAFTL